MPAQPHDHPAPATSVALVLDLVACAACDQVAEVTGSFTLPGIAGPEPYIRTRCVGGHMFQGPESALRGS